LRDLARGIREGSLSPVALAELSLDLLTQRGPGLNCVVTLTPERAHEQARRAEAEIKSFLKLRMYRHPRVMRVMGEAEQILFDLFARYQKMPGDLPSEWLRPDGGDSETERARRIGNFIAGMTDRFALTEHQRLFDSTPDLR
jgi:dGTP triphosphohydrolase